MEGRLRSVGGRLRGLLRHGLFQNVAFLYGIQLAGYLFPLLTVPYLTRVLGPSTWGLVAFTLYVTVGGIYLSLRWRRLALSRLSEEPH